MDANEEYVRSRWENLRAEPYANAPSHLCIRVGGSRFVNSIAGSSEAWQAAADFTHERERQIAEVEEEIDWMRSARSGWREHLSNMTREMFAAPKKRIIAREQTALAELTRGMKENL